MAKVEQNPQRYSTAGGGIRISAQAEFAKQFPDAAKPVPPLDIAAGPPLTPAPLPLLEVDGVIVNVDGVLIASAKTIADLAANAADSNPHSSPITSPTKVGGQDIGGSMPTLTVSTSGFVAAGDAQDIKNRKAGVFSVDYLYEGPTTGGIPDHILEQVNYTLNPTRPRPSDTFEVYKLKLGGDYGIRAIVTETMQTENYLQKDKLARFMTEVTDRMTKLRDDFNGIKRTFFNGATPPNQGTETFTKQASVDDDYSHDVVIKEYQLTGLTVNK